MFDLVSPDFHQNIHTGMQYGYFLINQKDLESKTISSKIFCNMHIACSNMHIVVESILPPTYVLLAFCVKAGRQFSLDPVV